MEGLFDVNGGAYFDIQKSDLGRSGMPCEIDGVMAIEAFKELGEEVGAGDQRRNMS